MPTNKKPTLISTIVELNPQTLTWGELRAIVTATTHQDDDLIDWHLDSDGDLDGVYVVLEV